jgi:transposase
VAGKDIIRMSVKELRRLPIIEKVIRKHLKQKEAAELLGLSDRQIRRISHRVGKEGERGLIHRNRGRPSNRKYPEGMIEEVLRLYQEEYPDFGPTFASEKLLKRQGIKIGKETLRSWLRAAQIPYKTRRGRPHRQWRERKHHFGEMIQIDGSHHAWLEKRGPELVWMGYVDDATGTVFGRFYEYEGTGPALDSFRRYVRKYGIPQSVYLDRHGAYWTRREPTIEEQLKNERPATQFERALRELGVRVIHAYSPQAKGRVERSFRTFQDRLIKEMRLEGIATLVEANRFVGRYLKHHNKRFSVPATQSTDLHRPIPPKLNLNTVLCVKEQRTVRNDGTIMFDGRLYQIRERTRAKKVIVEQWTNGSLHISYKGRALRYKLIVLPLEKKQAVKKTVTSTRKKKKRLAMTSPWRKRTTMFYGRKARERLRRETEAA